MSSFEDGLDAELGAGLAKFPALPDFRDVPASRQALADLMVKYPRVANTSGVNIKDRRIAGMEGAPQVRVRVYRRATGGRGVPGLLYMHGGGYIVGTPEAEDDPVCHIVREVGCVAVSVDYRLSPEHKAPAAVEDCYAALKWMHTSAAALGIDDKRIAIGGRSAGGGLAAGLALMARDRAEVFPVFQMLIYPMIDDRTAAARGAAISDPRVWNHDHNGRAWAHYLASAPGGPQTSPYAAACRAKDLSGLPPAYIAIGEAEVFLQENIAYAQRLKEAGVSTELHVFPGAFHGWEGSLPTAAISQRAINERVAVLTRAFRG
ncbi:MAG: alpha/beta hydrolase [Betaproteobacteria bacterium]|nr:alpha/beta hydrolase [Betaproteobacteria bacterium]